MELDDKDDFIHIYDLEKKRCKKMEFSYFVTNFTDKTSPWDKNCFYYGHLFTTENESIKVKIPYIVYILIPEDLKYEISRFVNHKRFRIDKYGKIETPKD